MGLLEDKVNEPQFEELADWQVAEILNAADESLPVLYQNVAKEDLISILMIGDKWLEIKENAKGNIEVPINRLCSTIFDALTMGGAIFHLTDPKVLTAFSGILNNLLTNNLIDNAIYSEVIAKVTRNQSWAEHNNVKVTARTVGIARGGIA